MLSTIEGLPPLLEAQHAGAGLVASEARGRADRHMRNSKGLVSCRLNHSMTASVWEKDPPII